MQHLEVLGQKSDRQSSRFRQKDLVLRQKSVYNEVEGQETKKPFSCIFPLPDYTKGTVLLQDKNLQRKRELRIYRHE